MSTGKLIIYCETEKISLNGRNEWAECGEKAFPQLSRVEFPFCFYNLQKKGLMVVKTVLTAAPGSGKSIVLFNGIFSHGWEFLLRW